MRSLIIATIILLTAGCTRRPLSDYGCSGSAAETMEVFVSVDWSLSGFDLDEDYVHRVAFRFFPTDGSAVFERYLEDDVTSGVIEVPVGEYSVVVYNESIYDTYWQESIIFEDVDSFDLFAAEIVERPSDAFDFYTPAEEEILSMQALQLASGSVEEFVVSEEMSSSNALNPISLRRLTCPTTIEVDVENLSSAYSVHVSLTGLSQRVFMASGDTDNVTITHIDELTERSWHDSTQQHGIISESLLTFSTPPTDTLHILTLGVILIDGSKHESEEDLIYDVTDQILGVDTRYADDDLGANVALSLPEVSGDVEVEEWADNEIVIIK